MEVAINKNIYNKAQSYAQKQGTNIAAVIEDFLMLFIVKNEQNEKQTIPDVVLSLVGAGEPIADDDLNGRNAYYKYIEEKYK